MVLKQYILSFILKWNGQYNWNILICISEMLLVALCQCLHDINSNMTSFIGYINNVMIKLRIYFDSHMRIVEHIINIILKWFQALMQDRGAYTHFFNSEKNTKDNHLTTLIFVIFRLAVTRNAGDIDASWLQFILRYCEHLLLSVAKIKMSSNWKISAT